MQSKYLIKKEFLQPTKYSQLLQQAQTYEQIFKRWLAIISEDYRGSNKPPSILPSTFAPDKKTDNIALKMQSLIIPQLNSLYDMSSQHIEYVTDLAKPAALNYLKKETDKVISSVKNYNLEHERILTTNKELLSAQNRLIITPTQNVQFYFTSNWSKRLASFEKYIAAVKNISPDLLNVEKLYKQSGQIEIQLLEYRKKILTFKYGVLKQGIKMARKLLVCFSQYILIGNQMLSKVNDKLRQSMSEQYRKSQSITSYDVNSKQYHENFALKAQTFRDTLYKIRNMFQSHQDPVVSNQLIMKLKQAFVGNEYFLVEIQDVFNLFEFFGTKKKEIVERMNQTIKKMDGWYSQNRKAVQVYNTLNRHSNILQVNGNERLRKSSGFKSESSEIESVEQAIAQCMEHSFQIYYEMGQSCQKLSQKIIQSLNTQTNMSVSYQYQEIKIKHKRPSKNQIWLWKDWRDFGGFEEMKPKYEEPFLNKEATKMKNLFDLDQQDMMVSCDLEGRYHCQARMLIFPEKVKITSKRDDKVDIILPFSEMESVEVVKKKLLIKMAGGAQIKCSGFKKVHEVENKISEYLQAKSEGGNGSSSAPSKPVIQITAEELQAISKRSSQIQGLKQKMDDYAKYGETTLTNVSIQQVYDCIFSDKNNSPLSKSMSFFQYTNHKSGNLNYKEEKYNKPGPYYYTGQDKQTTFVNCPLFSERVIMLDHPLPPIPFVPKVAHVKSKDKILWISDKQLEYQSLATSSGSDMMESFYTVNLYKIKEVEKNTVQIQIHCKMVFVKETRMKSILLNGAINELKAVIPGIILQIEKSMKAYVRSRSKDSKQPGDKASQEQDEEQDENLPGTKKENSSQSIGTKFLALFVIGTILLNVIIHVLF